MEFIDGEDLASLLRRIGRLPGDKAAEIGRQICAGLAAAHDQGVLHRDLKPANVMIDGRGKARVTDFGLAVVSKQVRGDDAMSGTPAYMAPEQLAGLETTSRSDIYALGLVLYELFTGRKAFEARTWQEFRALHESSRSGPRPLSESSCAALSRSPENAQRRPRKLRSPCRAVARWTRRCSRAKHHRRPWWRPRPPPEH